MTVNGWLQIAFFALAVLLVTKPLGLYLVAVYEGRVRWLAPVERLLYRLAGVDPDEDQHWTRYAVAVLLFSAASLLLTYL
ncbi:MAG: potassium-transporting ATPase subunit KdpA, partial [Gemmatimonadales bacterium]